MSSFSISNIKFGIVEIFNEKDLKQRHNYPNKITVSIQFVSKAELLYITTFEFEREIFLLKIHISGGAGNQARFHQGVPRKTPI